LRVHKTTTLTSYVTGKFGKKLCADQLSVVFMNMSSLKSRKTAQKHHQKRAADVADAQKALQRQSSNFQPPFSNCMTRRGGDGTWFHTPAAPPSPAATQWS